MRRSGVGEGIGVSDGVPVGKEVATWVAVPEGGTVRGITNPGDICLGPHADRNTRNKMKKCPNCFIEAALKNIGSGWNFQDFISRNWRLSLQDAGIMIIPAVIAQAAIFGRLGWERLIEQVNDLVQ